MPEHPPPPRHVFIVGLPRTGSTLTHRILNRSPHVRLAGETHFLGSARGGDGYARRFARIGDLRTEEGLRRVLDAIYGLRGKSFWSRFAQQVDRSAFEAALRASDRSARGLFEAAMREYAMGRPVAGDKSPEHIHAVPTLMSWFPDAAVIHTFRDPRAVYVSLRRKERSEALSAIGRAARKAGPLFEAYASTNLALRWRRMARLHRQYAGRYPSQYTLLKFEDMLADPEAATRRLCEFIGIPFEAAMLEQVVHNSSYQPKLSGEGIDRSAAERWRQHLPAATERWLLRLCGPDMAALGYAR
jgi:hypothetical protein